MVTISRDSFFLNSAYRDMIKVLSKQLLIYFDRHLHDNTKEGLIIANQYILAKKIKVYLKQIQKDKAPQIESEGDRLIRRLAEAKVYRLSGGKHLYSLIDLNEMKSQDKPLFFSLEQTNIRWMKNAFKYDFIVLPEEISLNNGAPDLYDNLFGEVFEEVVNLDTIISDNERIKNLVERGIADKSALSPKCEIIGERNLTKEEQQILREIDAILDHEVVKHTIERNIFIRFKKIHTVFFDIEEQGATVATGLFNNTGKALEKSAYSNFDIAENTNSLPIAEDKQIILLGLCRDHPFIQHLIGVNDAHRAYYTLIFIAYEISLCQKLLVPYSPFFYATAHQLAADMRRALMQQLLSDN